MMKFVAVLFAIMSLVTINTRSEDLCSQKIRDARRFGAETKIDFSIVDDMNNPISDATVSASFYMNEKGEYTHIGQTNDQGFFSIENKSVGEVNYYVSKSGYYPSRGRVLFSDKDFARLFENGQWQPYGKVCNVILKPIKNPVPMNAYHFEKKIPKTDSLIGFDLLLGDYTPPHGFGRTADFYISYTHEENSFWNYCSRITLTFPDVEEGAYTMDFDGYSEFMSAYSADTCKMYSNPICFVYDSRKKETISSITLSENQYMVLKTRIIRNKDGEFVSACYSKIYGPFRFTRNEMIFVAYMNPRPNDTNLEFDISQNMRATNKQEFRICIP